MDDEYIDQKRVRRTTSIYIWAININNEHATPSIIHGSLGRGSVFFVWNNALREKFDLHFFQAFASAGGIFILRGGLSAGW